MALVAVWPNPLTLVLALLLIGTRQLGLAILMHDAAHRALFRNRALNDWVGNWLCAYPVWTDVKPYRPYHLKHHAKNYTAEDPDLGLVETLPVTRASLKRKFIRDHRPDQWKRAKATPARPRSVKVISRAPSAASVSRRRAHNALFLPLCVGRLLPCSGAAWLTTFQLVTRAIAEHAMAPDPADPLRNTRTTLVRLWDACDAPNGVNYHLSTTR
jgi:fatty acid desaturase